MEKQLFNAKTFFDLTGFEHCNLFKDEHEVWKSLSLLSGYIEQWFAHPTFKGTFDEKRKIYIGEGVQIEEGACMKGPAIIGPRCTIGHASLLRENCILGEGVHIGHGVEVKHSIFLNRAISAHLNYIGDSIVGSEVNISGGAMIANFRLDKKSVSVSYNGRKIDTGLPKFGAVVGDGSMIGVNAVLNPGTILGKKCVIYPLTSVVGTHANESVIARKT